MNISKVEFDRLKNENRDLLESQRGLRETLARQQRRIDLLLSSYDRILASAGGYVAGTRDGFGEMVNVMNNYPISARIEPERVPDAAERAELRIAELTERLMASENKCAAVRAVVAHAKLVDV